MSDYTELVEALRHTDFGDTCDHCERWGMCKDDDCIILQAAAAIEALEARLGEAENSVERWKDMYLTKHEPKRGEIVRCRECRWGHLCVMGQHLGLDGFCSKGEREVQE